MSLHKQYRRDKTTAWLKVTDGVEIECSHFDARQPDYINNMTRITKPVRKLVEQNLLKPEQDRRYAVQAFTETCIKGWRTLVGTEYRNEIDISVTDTPEWLPFTVDNAVTVFTKYPQFYSDTVDLARDLASYQVSEEEVKNSATA